VAQGRLQVGKAGAIGSPKIQESKAEEERGSGPSALKKRCSGTFLSRLSTNFFDWLLN